MSESSGDKLSTIILFYTFWFGLIWIDVELWMDMDTWTVSGRDEHSLPVHVAILGDDLGDEAQTDGGTDGR